MLPKMLSGYHIQGSLRIEPSAGIDPTSKSFGTLRLLCGKYISSTKEEDCKHYVVYDQCGSCHIVSYPSSNGYVLPSAEALSQIMHRYV
jgi:hypothetical protein